MQYAPTQLAMTPPGMPSFPPPPKPSAVTITVPAAVSWPQGCANCGSPPGGSLGTSLKVGRTTRTYQYPVCQRCGSRARSHGRSTVLLWFVGVAIAGGLAYLELPFRKLAAIVFPASMGAAFVIALLIFLMRRPSKPVPPFTSATHAVRLTAWNATHAWFYCTNADWAAEAARLSGGQINPTNERPYRAWGTFWSIVIFAALFSGATYAAARPSVCFRNPTSEPLTFYVDGAAIGVVQPNQHKIESVIYGHRTIGWSPAAASAPATTIDADLVMGKEHLVNPNEAGCFWMEGAAYGSAHVDEKTLGPLPLQTFYTFDKVDLWFTDLPKSISTKQSGETRIAVQVYPLCVDMMKTCKKELIKKALVCDRAAGSNDDGVKCWEECAGLPKGSLSGKKDGVDADVALGNALANAKLVDASAPTDAGPEDAGKPKKKKKKPAAPTP
jgi:hypothetical protein